MKTILIVDDDAKKMAKLVEFVEEKLPGTSILRKRSYQSGLKSALLDRPTLMLLDMTMPTFDVEGKEGGRERRYAGVHILRQLRRKRSAVEAIIITQFESFGEGDTLQTLDELRKQLLEEFGDGHYLGTVYYQAAGSEWRDALWQLLLGSQLLKAEDSHAS